MRGLALGGEFTAVRGLALGGESTVSGGGLRVWNAEIKVMLKPSVNDPQGLSIRNALLTLGFNSVDDVRAGKLIQVRFSAQDRHAAEQAVDRMCSQLLANPVIETYEFSLSEQPAPVP